MSVAPGDYIGKITGHGTDTSGSGLAFVWISVALPGVSEAVTCRLFLESNKGQEATDTAVRMTRAALKLCGFDPDVSSLEDLDNVRDLLVGNECPVNVSERESGGKFYTNYNITSPRGVDSARAKSLTDRLRAAKTKDEPPVKKQGATRFNEADVAKARAALNKNSAPEDIPF